MLCPTFTTEEVTWIKCLQGTVQVSCFFWIQPDLDNCKPSQAYITAIIISKSSRSRTLPYVLKYNVGTKLIYSIMSSHCYPMEGDIGPHSAAPQDYETPFTPQLSKISILSSRPPPPKYLLDSLQCTLIPVSSKRAVLKSEHMETEYKMKLNCARPWTTTLACVVHCHSWSVELTACLHCWGS